MLGEVQIPIHYSIKFAHCPSFLSGIAMRISGNNAPEIRANLLRMAALVVCVFLWPTVK